MADTRTQVAKLAELIFTLRQKCALKDLYFIKRAGISSAEYNCLMQFFGSTSIGMKELGGRLDITPGGVTRIITGLEDKGIVERRIDAEDRRGINVILTRKGERLVRDMRQASLEIHTDIIERIEASSRKGVIEAIERLIRAIDSWLESNSNAQPGNGT
jgi:DNA-binding MarR family transcriptional regulator